MSNNAVQAMIGAGLSKSFAYHVAGGTRSISVPFALWLHETDGLKVGPLTGKTPAQIRALRSIYEPKAPDSVMQRRKRN